ncbi:hypothetical protein [uncultured Paracoccus sp.]|uniref:hypothetical protein n=1 Tax=uncultured Paracoccus sp. TaxID=189685 RepID=UPI0025D35A3A|nr:hypothetical protein [uncultured Paracoccus sp.]
MLAINQKTDGIPLIESASESWSMEYRFAGKPPPVKNIRVIRGGGQEKGQRFPAGPPC